MVQSIKASGAKPELSVPCSGERTDSNLFSDFLCLCVMAPVCLHAHISK